MIAKLIGTVDIIEDDNFILLCNGVGYQIFTSKSVLSSIQENTEIVCHIQTIVKEDSITLYGFNLLEDKKLFNLIITVPGVGPKIALLLIGAYSVNEIISAIMNDNINLFRSVSGIGVKVAQRIVTELKDKIKKFITSNENKIINSVKDEINQKKNTTSNTQYDDVIEALTNIGYTQNDVKRALDYIKPDFNIQDTSDIIKEALKFFASSINVSTNNE